MNKKQSREFHDILKSNYPDARPSLHFNTTFELLIAVILSAQTTDNNVNKATSKLFEEFPTPELLANAGGKHVENLIHSLGFFRQKTKSIIGSANAVVHKFQGEVPRTIKELISLPGVGRKTANIVLSFGFGKNEGVAVDTHVKRLANRFGFTTQSDPNKIEKDLMEIFDRSEWGEINLTWILHGRAYCTARKPNCSKCFLKSRCPKIGV